MRCPHCNQEHPSNAIFCPLTGKKILAPGFCSQCGKPIESEWLLCPFCGHTLDKEVPALDQQVSTMVSAPPAANVETEPLETHLPSPRKNLPLILIGLVFLLVVAVVTILVFWNRVDSPIFAKKTLPEKILFVSSRGGNNDIYLIDSKGGDAINLTNNPADDSNPILSPDGQKIAFTTNRDSEANLEIYVMDADGSNQTRLTTKGAGFGNFAFSPDGQKIAYAAYDLFSVDIASMTADQVVNIMNVDGSNLTQLTTNHTYMANMGFSWPIDGRVITYVSIRDGKSGIYTINADGGGEKILSNNYDYALNYSKDGKKIAFTSHRDGNPEIYSMNADGSNQVRLTNNPSNDSYPVWSPDGQKIAFMAERDGNIEMYLMNADGSGQTNLTNNPGMDAFYKWSEDGQQLTFASDREGNYEVYVVNVDGSELIRLTNSPGDDLYPVWSHADSSRISQKAPLDKPTLKPQAAVTGGVLVKPANPIGIAGYLKSINEAPYTITLVDDQGRKAFLEVQGELRWDKDGRLTQWEDATFRFQTEYDPATWSEIINAEVVDGVLVLTTHFGFYTVFTEGHVSTMTPSEVVKAKINGGGQWAGQATYIITGFNPQNFSAMIHQDTSNYQIQVEATNTPTAITTPTEKPTPITVHTPVPQTPVSMTGWVEYYGGGMVTFGQETPTALDQIMIFHGTDSVISGNACPNCYILEPAVDIQLNLPAEDINGSDIVFRTGETYEYLIKGYLTDRTLDDFFMGGIPIFEVQYLERLK